MNDYDFIEEHTALSDALIESQILTKALKKGKVEPTLYAFPFRDLGTTVDYVINKQNKYINSLFNLLEEYMEKNNGFEKAGIYWNKMRKDYDRLDTHRTF